MKVIGLISGTSVDGIDAALVEITGQELDLQVQLLSGKTYPYPPTLREQILAVCSGKPLSLEELATLDDAIALQFAAAARQIQAEYPTVELIGSHGQTVYHRPPVYQQESTKKLTTLGYSWQMGRGEIIANYTGIATINNFRSADIAAGGEGAPLVSKIDACLLAHPTKCRAIQNLGGIGNVTYLPPHSQPNWQEHICGWDTGPGNVLIDLAVQKLTDGRETYDLDGSWSAHGTPNFKLVHQWLEEDFFRKPPPKSTGRELFGTEYLAKCWQDIEKEGLNQSDSLATITELTVASVIDSYHNFLPQMPDEILLCGGGSRNIYLRQRLQAELTSAQIIITDEVGISGDFKEAIAFAVLAYWRYHGVTGNIYQVTGAAQPRLLGDIHLPLKI
ncbi:MAG: anhydro-N-acetylmuramic acid kinase [Pleurocapsa sp.]